MLKKIDARGLACPQPVVLTKKALEDITSGIIEVIVDNKPASENVSRFARNSGCNVEVREDKGNFIIKVTKGEAAKVSKEKIVCKLKPQTKKETVFLIASDTIGQGSDELGGILMKILFPTLLEVKPKPDRVIFMNNGIKLTVEGSEFLDSLGKLEKAEVELLVCGTCLDYFGLKEKVKVGRISNFFEITEALLNAEKVIRL